ncbi:MAG: hypothetical protein ABGY42_12260 [bacterium]
MVFFRVIAFALVFALSAMVPPAFADGDEVRLVSGTVTFVSSTAVEVNGIRALVLSDSSIMSDRREISLASVRSGLPATMEIDASGRLLELQVRGVIE